MNAAFRRGAAMQHPPRRVRRGSSIERLARQIHDGVTESTELILPQRFSEEVSNIIRSVDVWHGDSTVLNQLPYVKMLPSDVLGALVVLGIICEIASGLVVDA